MSEVADAKRPVWRHLMGAKTMLGFADAEIVDLDELTRRLLRSDQSLREREDVWRTYVSWLMFCRQVAVSVDKAGKAAGRPADFLKWWDGLNSDPVHAFFREERNAALKEVAHVIKAKPIDVGDDEQRIFWAFPHGPHASDPLVPRCQQYNEWLYNSLRAPACELLLEWTGKEREAFPDVALI